MLGFRFILEDTKKRCYFRYSRFEETESYLETGNDDSEGNGQDQEGETPINAS